MRVKQGLAAAKAKGVKLGRPKGSRNRHVGVAIEAALLRHVAVEGVNLDRFGKIASCKGDAVVPAIECLDGILGDYVVVRRVAIVAGSDRFEYLPLLYGKCGAHGRGGGACG
jgi:hypothetical protein